MVSVLVDCCRCWRAKAAMADFLFKLLLWAQVARVSALLLAAVHCSRVKTSVAFSTNHLVTIVLLSEKAQRGLNGDTTAQTEHKVKRGLLLNVVVRESAAVLELLAGEDQTLLVGRDALLVLDLGLDVLDRVRGLDLERDRLASECLDEDLHFFYCVCSPQLFTRKN